MAATITVPQPPSPDVARFDANGRPTKAQVEYEAKVQALLKALVAKVTQV